MILVFFTVLVLSSYIANGCRQPSEVTSLAIDAAQGEYELGVVCGHVGNYYCGASSFFFIHFILMRIQYNFILMRP